MKKVAEDGAFAVLELTGDPKQQKSTTDIADKYGISIHHLAKARRCDHTSPRPVGRAELAGAGSDPVVFYPGT
jgi:hypothetical protein